MIKTAASDFYYSEMYNIGIYMMIFNYLSGKINIYFCQVRVAPIYLPFYPCRHWQNWDFNCKGTKLKKKKRRKKITFKNFREIFEVCLH